MPVLVSAPKSESEHASTDSRAQGNNALTAAIARSLARGAALYFSRPVRLFRPAKGMHSVWDVRCLACIDDDTCKSVDGLL